MRAGWEIKTIGDVCDIFDRKRKPISKRDREPGPYPYYGASCIQDYVSGYLFDGKYLLIGEDGAKWGPGEDTAYIAEGKFWVNNHAHIVKAKEGYLDDYLRYYIKHLDLNPIVAGAIIPKLTQEKLTALEVPIPSLPEQQRIVDILDLEFAKIDALKANAEKSLQAAKDLFQATLKKELEPKERWETKHLNEWAEYSIGLTYKPADVSKEGTIVLRSSNIQNDQLVFDDIVRVVCKVKDELFVKDGDILMCSRNGSARLVGKVARIGKERERMTYGTFMTIIRSTYNPILFYYFKSDDFRSQITKGENPMINQITKYMLNDVVISLPSNLDEVSSVARSLDDLNDKCKTLQENYQKTFTLCDDLKQALLRKAFNGDL